MTFLLSAAALLLALATVPLGLNARVLRIAIARTEPAGFKNRSLDFRRQVP